jgi:hypothetical protein
MQEVKNEKREINGIKIFGVIFPFLPKLLFKFSITFLRFKRRAKKAGKTFRKELMKQGLNKQTASELTEIYMKGSQIKNVVKVFR